MENNEEMTKILEAMSITQLKDIAKISQDLIATKWKRSILGLIEIFSASFERSGKVTLEGEDNLQLSHTEGTRVEVENFNGKAVTHLNNNEIDYWLRTGNVNGHWTEIALRLPNSPNHIFSANMLTDLAHDFMVPERFFDTWSNVVD